jgi:hypothetical protein
MLASSSLLTQIEEHERIIKTKKFGTIKEDTMQKLNRKLV